MSAAPKESPHTPMTSLKYALLIDCAWRLAACSSPGADAADGPQDELAPSGATLPCREDPARAARALAILAAHPEGATLVPSPPPRICWSARDLSVVDDARRLHVDESLGDDAAAARAAHLLLHVRDGLPHLDPCVDLARVEALERAGHALEERILEDLGAQPPAPRAVERVMAQYRARCAD